MPIQPKQQPPYYTTPENAPQIQRYVATLIQTSTNAPTANILQNTFNETISFAYLTTGAYRITKTTPFTDGKFSLMINQDDPAGRAIMLDGEDGTITIQTYESGILADGRLYKTTIIIEQFNH